MHTFAHAYMHIHTYIHTYIHTHIHAHIHMHVCAHIHTCAYTHAHAYTYVRTHTHTHRYNPAAGDLGQLCEQVLVKLEECLGFDLHLFEDACSERVHVILTTNQSESGGDVSMAADNQACLPCDLLLKVAALSILPSHCLRLQGTGSFFGQEEGRQSSFLY